MNSYTNRYTHVEPGLPDPAAGEEDFSPEGGGDRGGKAAAGGQGVWTVRSFGGEEENVQHADATAEKTAGTRVFIWGTGLQYLSTGTFRPSE